MKSSAKRLSALMIVAVIFGSFAADAAFARWVTIRNSNGTYRRVWVDDGRPGLNWGHTFPGNPYRAGQQQNSDAGQLQITPRPQLNSIGKEYKPRQKRVRRRFPAR
jgi:hypothetical protein